MTTSGEGCILNLYNFDDPKPGVIRPNVLEAHYNDWTGFMTIQPHRHQRSGEGQQAQGFDAWTNAILIRMSDCLKLHSTGTFMTALIRIITSAGATKSP